MARKTKLNAQHRLFVDHYMIDFNATEAARKSNYKGDYATLRVTGHRLLTYANIQAEIVRRMETYAMDANEAMARLAQQARGVDSGSLALIMRAHDTGQALQIAQQLGVGHLIKNVKKTVTHRHDKEGNIISTTERFHIDTIDTQAALFKVLQYTQEMKPQRLVIEDVRAEAIRLIKANEVDFEAMVNQFGKHDAELLFELAGVPV